MGARGIIYRSVSACIAYCLSNMGVWAQDRGRCWTLEQCITYAIDNNIEIKRQQLVGKTKTIALSESRWAYSPTAAISSSGTMSTGRVLDQTTYEFIKNSTVGSSSSSVYGSMNIFNGFRKMYALQRAKIDLRADAADMEAKKYDIRKEVTAVFLFLLCAQSDLDSAEQTLALLTSQADRISVLVESGKVTESDLMQAKSQIFAAESDLSTAEGAVESAKLALCQLLEIKDYTSFSVIGDEDVPPMPMRGGVEELVTLRPEYRSGELAIEMASKDLSIARSDYYPSLSLSAGYGSSWSSAREKSIQNPDGTFRYEAYPFFEQYLDNRSSYVSLSLNIPIFNAMSVRNGVKRRKVALKDAEYALQTTRKELSKEYLQAEIDCRTAYKKYLSAEQQLSYAEEAERQVRERYDLGGADFNTWNTSATELAKARYSLSEAKYTYIFKVKVLEMF